MIRKYYNTMILRRIETSFDKIIPIGAVVSWASAAAIYFSPIPKRFVAINVTTGFIFMILSVFKEKIEVENKILLTILAPMLIGVLSFLDGGFGSAGIQLIMISNIMAVLFLSKRKSFIIAVVSMIIFISLFIYAYVTPVKYPLKMDLALWFVQFIVFALYLFILHTVVYSIRDYLLENIESLQESIDKTFKLAYYDQLTGLPNQYQFKDELGKIEAKNKEGYILIWNVKNLSLINSVYDDDVGDQVLIRIGQLLNEVRLSSEKLARISGNEFGIWIGAANTNIFNDRLKTYCDYVEKFFEIPHVTKKIEFNISYTKHNRGDQIEDTLHKSKLALTYVKTNSDVAMIEYNDELEHILKDDEFVKERLEIAVDSSKFDIYYQAKVDSNTKEVVSVEALARWTDEIIGMISPSIFVPLLEDMNQSIKFGEIVINKVFEDYKSLCDKYHGEIGVSINISPTHFVSQRFIDFIKTKIWEHKIDPKYITVEITEEVMIESFDSVRESIDSLKAIGMKVSLDDFGSGYSSLSYLVKLDIDELKIDKSFVEQLEFNSNVDVMFEVIMKLSEHYNLNIVAEGVETEGQYQKLRIMGCHEIQGFYFSIPEPLLNAEKWTQRLSILSQVES